MASAFQFYMKGRGPFGDGTSHAQRYEAHKMAFLGVLNEAEEGNRIAKVGIDREVRHALNLRKKDMTAAQVQGVPILSTLSVKYAPGELIGLELMPIVTTDHQSATYYYYPQRSHMQEARTKGRAANRGTVNELPDSKETRTFAVKLDTLEGHVGLDVILNQQNPLNEMLDMVEGVNLTLAMNRERDIMTALTTTANYGSGNFQTLTGAARWDQAGADIVGDIQAGIAAIWRGNGTSELIAACSTEVWNLIQRSAALLGMLSLNDRGLITPAQFCEIFGLDGLLVSDARTDIANIGAADGTYRRLWGNFFVIVRVSRTTQIRNAAFGYTFRWTGNGAAVPGGFPGGVYSQFWYDQRQGGIGAYYYKRSTYEDRVIAAPAAGFLWVTPSSATF